MRRLFAFGFIFFTLALATQNGMASDTTQFIRMPSTIFGPSGLLLTQSIDTLSPGNFDVGLGLSTGEEISDLSETAVSATVTLGLTPTLEASAQIPYFTEVKVDKDGESESALGNISLSLKWRFMDPNIHFNFPGIGLSFTLFLPTGDVKVGAGSVDTWGLKTLIVSSAEAEIGTLANSILVGFYANGGIYIQDTGDTTEEKHGLVDLGILIPLNQSKAIQFLLEGNARINRNRVTGQTTSEADYIAITPGLRYVTKQMALTGGWQQRFNQDADEDTGFFLFQGSYLF